MSKTHIVLLRAINVGGRKLVMADLREAAAKAGCRDFRTYIQSGNLLLTSDDSAAEVEAAVEALIADAFDMKAIAMARTADHFDKIAAANPFSQAEAKYLHLCLTKRPIAESATETIVARAQHGEQVAVAGGALWIDFAGGVGNSKLLPAFLDKAAGSTVTARNWNSVRKLIAMSRDES